MFRNPINAFPYGSAVDLTTTGNTVNFSFEFQGDILRQWCIEIRDIDNDTIYYTTPVQNNISTPKYNGDICTAELTIGSGGFVATTVSNLSWSVYMNDSTTLLTTSEIIVDNNTYQSNGFYFINSAQPTVENATINDTIIPSTTEPTAINTYELSYKAQYASNATNASLKYHKFILSAFTSSGAEELIVETDNMYSSNIQFYYDGLANNTTYTLTLILVNQDDLQTTYTYPLKCIIEEASNFEVNVRSITCDTQKCANVIQWYQEIGSQGQSSILNNFEGVNDSFVKINSGYIYYNEINGENIALNQHSFAYSFRVSIPANIIWQNTSFIRLFELSLTNSETGVGQESYRIAVRNGYLYYYNKKDGVDTRGQICPTTTNVAYALQTTSTPDVNTRYLWYNSRYYNWFDDSTHYWITNDMEGAENVTFVITVQYYNDKFHYYVGDTWMVDSDPILPDASSANATFKLYSPCIFDNFIAKNGDWFRTSDLEKFNQLDAGKDYTTLNWSDYNQLILLSNFIDGNINSGSSTVGSIYGYTIQKQALGEIEWSTVFSGSATKLLNLDTKTFTLKDYNIKNNTNYRYRFIPLTAEATPIITIYPFEDSSPLLTNWEVFTLTPLVVDNNTNISNFKNATPLTINGVSQVWTFIANCEESPLTKNQDKTYFDTFTQFPKVSVGNANYFTFNFSALLGSIDNNCNYYETTQLLEQWNEFINGNYICLYKNLKGDARIVSINADSTNTYANTYANYYQDNDGYITNRPTTISINLTEVDDGSKYRITGGEY